MNIKKSYTVRTKGYRSDKNFTECLTPEDKKLLEDDMVVPKSVQATYIDGEYEVTINH